MNALIRWFQKSRAWCVLRYYLRTRNIETRPVRFRVRPMVAWYDTWMGVYVDRKARQVYVFPLPCLGFQIGYQSTSNTVRVGPGPATGTGTDDEFVGRDLNNGQQPRKREQK